MRKILIVFALAVPLAALPGLTAAKGSQGWPVPTAKACLKGAAVGGVAGHVAGHHGLAGAAVGCMVEHHREKVQDQKKAEQPKADSAAPRMGSAIAPEGGTAK